VGSACVAVSELLQWW